jgi:TRAP-type C4-dicarboxylate transport system permease small subunit
MARFEKIMTLVTRWLNWVAAAAIMAVVLIVCANVIGRAFFQMPVKGTVDITSLLGAIIIGWAIAHTQMLKGHIQVDLFVDRLPRRARDIVDIIVNIINLLLFAIISWQTVIFAKATFEVGELSQVLKIPQTPFIGVVAVGCIALALVLLIDVVKSVSKAVAK